MSIQYVVTMWNFVPHKVATGLYKLKCCLFSERNIFCCYAICLTSLNARTKLKQIYTIFLKLWSWSFVQILALFKFCFLLHSKHTASSLRRPNFKGEKLLLFVVRLKRDI